MRVRDPVRSPQWEVWAVPTEGDENGRGTLYCRARTWIGGWEVTFHRLLVVTATVFLLAATLLSFRRGEAAVISAAASAAAVVVGYRFAEAFRGR